MTVVAATLSLNEIATTRRQAVASFAASGKTPSQIASELATRGIVNPTTGKPYSRQTIRTDLRQTKVSNVAQTGVDNARVFRKPMSETIGQWTYVKPQWNARVLLNVDSTWIDYVFWDALRRGTAAGFEISGPAFCLPAAQTTVSYIYGKGVSASLVESAIPADASKPEKRTLHEALLSEANGKPTQNKKNALNTGKPAANKMNPANSNGNANPSTVSPLAVLPKATPDPNAGDRVAYTNMQLQQMLRNVLGFLVNMTVDDYCLGNQFVICNPDCTFSVASPETVTVEYSAADYRRVERVIIRTKMQQALVEDVYTDKKRSITYKYYDQRGTVTEEYENLIGRIPIVHFANDRSANEIYGRPIYQAGLPIMWRYDALINNILEGVTLLGTPIPMFTGLDNPTETKVLNSDAITYLDDQGNQQTQYVTRLDRQTGLYIGKGGDGKMLSTNVGFTKDSIDSLHQLKLLWLNITHIPEFILGGAIASSKASTETQMPPFIQYINFRRLMLEGEGANPALGIDARGGLMELIDIWLRMHKLLNPNIVVGPVRLEWPEIDVQNDQVKYMWGTYLSGTGKINDEATVRMSGYFADPKAEVQKAAGQKARPPQFDTYDKQLRKARLEAQQAEMDPPSIDKDGLPFATDWITPAIDLTGAGASGHIDSVDEHQHAEGAAMTGDPWSVDGPLFWLNMFGMNNG